MTRARDTVLRLWHIFCLVPQWIRVMAHRLGRDRNADYAVTSMALCDHPVLRAITGDSMQFHSRLLGRTSPTLIGWGHKTSGLRARRIAQKNRQPCLLIEDGFLRSFARHDPPLSLVRDDQGIYYDARHPSRLQDLIQMPLNDTQTARAQALVRWWCAAQVSKYNDAADYHSDLPARYILVVDQVADDLSIAGGGAGPADFAAMLQAALSDHPDAAVVLKLHPDVVCGGKKGHFDPDQLDRRVVVISDHCHPVRLIAQAAAVYTVTSQLGFEALLHGKPVHCFGVPFYAGLGLTQDAQGAPLPRRPASLAQLVHAALIGYMVCIDPETRACCEIETLVTRVAAQRARAAPVAGLVHAYRLSRRKRRLLRRFMPATKIRFCTKPHQIPHGATVAVWGILDVHALRPARVLRIEDGFIRSNGLGAALCAPLSWVIDEDGIHFDPRGPSRLERLLQDTAPDPALRARAKDLIAAITARGVTKYNLGAPSCLPPPTERRVILVPGQVETDASLRCGAPGVQRNIDLLRAVRRANPQAFIVYKPHPDVASALRQQGLGEDQAAGYCNQIVPDGDAAALLDHVDEVHTMTSLVGFEALLRGCDVTCYGQPFYAGWGLTTDLHQFPRRKARLDLVDLVAGALIAYPRYLDPVTGSLTTPERIVAHLSQRPPRARHLPYLRQRLRLFVLQCWARFGCGGVV